jgi:hypothetical protein
MEDAPAYKGSNPRTEFVQGTTTTTLHKYYTDPQGGVVHTTQLIEYSDAEKTVVSIVHPEEVV